jgi:hypothetical protein
MSDNKLYTIEDPIFKNINWKTAYKQVNKSLKRRKKT